MVHLATLVLLIELKSFLHLTFISPRNLKQYTNDVVKTCDIKTHTKIRLLQYFVSVKKILQL